MYERVLRIERLVDSMDGGAMETQRHDDLLPSQRSTCRNHVAT